MARPYTIHKQKSPSKEYDNRLILESLLSWYKKHKRDLPWRVKSGVKPDPYKIWLSEIMLQQTTVQTVKPYFEKFVRRWPTIQGLAKASQEEVLAVWAGLGYYARGRNLHQCAQIVVSRYKGKFPQTLDELKNLPGIGAYTAGAISSIAFGKPCAAVDGNVERVVSRLHAIKTPLPDLKKEVGPHAQRLVELQPENSSNTVQALMDLGAMICTPKSPRCGLCPWELYCQGKALGIADQLPVKTLKKLKPTKHGLVFIIRNPEGRVLLERRPQKGLLAGMAGLPTSQWQKNKSSVKTDWPDFLKATGKAELNACGRVYHSFTHFDLILNIFELESRFLKKIYPKNLYWSKEQVSKIKGLPRVFEKCLLLCKGR